MNIPRREAGKPAVYTINEAFFRNWTPEMAYVLGFIITDGCVHHNTLAISQKEPYILERIRAVLESDFPIRHRINTHGGDIYTLVISRKSIVADLADLGVRPRKSLTVGLPAVPSEYMPHFIRGVLDGDGWVHAKGYTLNITTGSKAFADGLLFVFRQQGFNARITFNCAYRVWVSGIESVCDFGRWVYGADADMNGLYLERKRERVGIAA